MRVGLVTCRVLPEPDPDAKPLADALRARGHTPVEVPWDDPEFVLDGFDLFVIRSAWNYFEDSDGFLDWTYRAAQLAPMVNPWEVVNWNLHKGYLCHLGRRGISVVETRLLDLDLCVLPVAGDQPAMNALMSAVSAFGDVVIKPAIAAGSFGAKRFGVDENAHALGYALGLTDEGNDVIIQPYIAGFADPGERSLIWVDGKWTHAIRKHPRFSGQNERVEGGEPPTDAELELAQAAIDQVAEPIHYARADMVQSNNGELLLSELELIEPSLFFDHSAEALDRFVTMIEKQGSRR